MQSESGPRSDTAHILVRVWLPDRPGALALVAARIGAVGGDIVSVDVLERAEGIAIDEFSVIVPGEDVFELMTKEIEQVDGASVEQLRVVRAFPNPRIDALESAQRLCEAPTVPALHLALVERLGVEFLADWAVLLRDGTTLAQAGAAPANEEFLAVLAAGTAASPKVVDGTTGPDDLLVAALPHHDAVLLVGRDRHPFRRSERAQLVALANIADRTWTLLGD